MRERKGRIWARLRQQSTLQCSTVSVGYSTATGHTVYSSCTTFSATYILLKALTTYHDKDWLSR